MESQVLFMSLALWKGTVPFYVTFTFQVTSCHSPVIMNFAYDAQWSNGESVVTTLHVNEPFLTGLKCFPLLSPLMKTLPLWICTNYHVIIFTITDTWTSFNCFIASCLLLKDTLLISFCNCAKILSMTALSFSKAVIIFSDFY